MRTITPLFFHGFKIVDCTVVIAQRKLDNKPTLVHVDGVTIILLNKGSTNERIGVTMKKGECVPSQ
jgi:hypothetical protein